MLLISISLSYQKTPLLGLGNKYKLAHHHCHYDLSSGRIIRKFLGGLMAIAERQPIMGVWGRA